MAEEKIRVLIAKDPCEYCGIKPCARKCMVSQMYEKGPAIAKSEAIEKMAKAICAKKNCKDICNNCEVWLHFKDCAEAALNALLEDNK